MLYLREHQIRKRAFLRDRYLRNSPFETSKRIPTRIKGKGDAGATRKEVKGEGFCSPPQQTLIETKNNDAIVGGRLLRFRGEWTKVTSNPWVLDILLHGYNIEFLRLPPTKYMPPSPSMSLTSHSLIWQEVTSLLSSGVIIPVPQDQEKTGFYSSLFLVKKPNGTNRLIINLRGLNEFIVYRKFRMESDKGDHIKDLITRFRRKSVISIREAMKILGSLTACISSVAWCQAHSRILQGWILRSWNRKQEDLDRKIPIPPAVKEDLLWWLEDGNLRKGIFWSNSPYIPIQTDASQRGWGAVMPQQFSQGTWTEEITRRSSNFRELQAVWEALSANTPLLAHQHLLILSDNTTTVSYIKRQGGTRSPLLSTLARKIFLWAEQHTLSISATHLKGTENSRADFLSRRRILPNEWSLKEEIFQRLTSLWGYPLVDLFATRENTKCLHYFSLEKGENRERLDAFSHSWDIPLVYAFPPIPLIARVLRKISQENTRAIFICPNWPKKSWYPLLKKMSPENPVILPPSEDLLHQGPIHHPNPGKLQLSAWILNPAS
ncbi:hypothetical protein GDO81_021365 [Engystomops pustulosus]|uniref:Reverse transcriptase RNase H-like domain-containing protein n=1 Tax=Engystomops pustulosus TaxID=76066 RepID=A0AAV6YNX4_ENGPU|nr:hypothetical protein GDO81_021365 [Engystomops pustulosus]KAG8539135.1 hypothetical protein GDO81_021365 [Engystomops pustulosus]KAG8539136.1 hypothetical protein GDO81_021365 [Engystomops pustulosus]